MLREALIAMLIIIISISGYNIANNFMEPFKSEADANENVPNWLIDTVDWAWDHWVYMMIISAFVLLLIASQTKLPQGEWEF